MRRSNFWRLAVFAAVISVGFRAAEAQDTSGITVSGTGEVKGKPAVVEIGATLSADAELTADALVKYRDARKKAVAALEALKLSNLVIDSTGVTINSAVDAQQQMRVMQGMPSGPAAKQKVEVSEKMTLRLTGTDQLETEKVLEMILKLIDTSRDAGLALGPPAARNYYEMQIQAQMGRGASLAMFKITDASALKEKAFKLAMDDARQQATKLAQMAGVNLGRIISVHEAAPAKSDDQSSAAIRMMYYGWMGMANDREELSANALSEIPVRVGVTVQFEIEK